MTKLNRKHMLATKPEWISANNWKKYIKYWDLVRDEAPDDIPLSVEEWIEFKIDGIPVLPSEAETNQSIISYMLDDEIL